MARTIAIRVSERSIKTLESGGTVELALKPSHVVGGIMKRAGRRSKGVSRTWAENNGLPRAGSDPARLLLWMMDKGGWTSPQQATEMLGRRESVRGILSRLAGAGLARREQWGRYVVTAKARRSRRALTTGGPYLMGSHRERLLKWARGRRRPFGIPEIASLLGIARASVQVVLKPLLRDGHVIRESPGVYRSTKR